MFKVFDFSARIERFNGVVEGIEEHGLQTAEAIEKEHLCFLFHPLAITALDDLKVEKRWNRSNGGIVRSTRETKLGLYAEKQHAHEHAHHSSSSLVRVGTSFCRCMALAGFRLSRSA